jgi:hypothetical protein
MKKRLILLLSLYALPFLLCAQPDKLNLNDYNQERIRINKVGMSILGGWALSNMAISAASLRGASPEAKAFHQMNIGWNAVNGIIAGIGYYSATRASTQLGLLESVQAGEQMKSILLLNAGLDIGYMLGGFYLKERANRPDANQAQLRGFGKAVVMNGAFLLLFDSIMAWLHHQHLQKQLYQLASHVSLTPGSVTLSFAL